MLAYNCEESTVFIFYFNFKLFVFDSEVPEAPNGLKVLDKSGRTVQLSWSAPYNGNSPIKRYLIEYKVSKGKFFKINIILTEQ